MRPVDVLKKVNYKPWSLKLKHALKINKSWEVVIGTEAMPPPTAAAGATAAEVAAALALCAN